MHLWPELAYMPALDHWPNRPGPFRAEESEVLRFIAEGYSTDLEEATKIFHSAAAKGAIRFNRSSRTWSGKKGGSK